MSILLRQAFAELAGWGGQADAAGPRAVRCGGQA